MKKRLFMIWFFIMAFSFSFFHPLSLYAQNSEVETTIQDYFIYLKKGDTESILGSLMDPFHSQRRKLLTENSGYPQFLRDTYKDAYMEIKKIKTVEKGDKRAVDVEIYFNAQEPPLKTTFILKEENGLWKISEEVSE